MAPLVPRGAVLRRAATAFVAAGVALALAASPASATVTATIEFGDTVQITSTSGTDVVSISCLADEVNVSSTPPLAAFACTDVHYVDVDASGGVGSVNLGGLTRLAFPALDETSVHVEEGSANSVTGSEVRDVVHADFLDDVSTGLGDDWVEGAGSASAGEGDDTLRQISDAVQGGPGDDLIVGVPAGLLDGGTGVDTVVVDYSVFASEQAIGMVITDTRIDSFPDTSSIEAYDITSSDGGYADSVNSQGYSGRVTFHGRAGADTFVGGPGADAADLGAGNDLATPGPASDFVVAGDGDDTVSVRDGFGDVVECGAGTDTVTADRSDVLSGCEIVSLPAPETGQVAGPKKLHKGEKATFTFGSPVAGASFECQVDAGAFKGCASPFTVRTKGLKVGSHTIQVRAVQPVGNPDASPSTFTFKVTKRKRPAQA